MLRFLGFLFLVFFLYVGFQGIKINDTTIKPFIREFVNGSDSIQIDTTKIIEIKTN